MKTDKFFLISCVIFLLICGTAWAGDQDNFSGDSPAILASLDKAGLHFLDEHAAAEIRGQANPAYVLVKVLGLNTLDYGRGVKWTLNPLGYRYGFFGGYNWSNTGETPVDVMDGFFEAHDSTGDDVALLSGLQGLATTSSYWGNIYLSSPADAPSSVKVFGGSLIGQRFYFGWRLMPYSEYSRREAVYGMKALIFGKSLFPSLGF